MESPKQECDFNKNIMIVEAPPPLSWELYIDRVANQKGLGVKIVIISPKSITIEKSLRLAFLATNNEAEYEALRAKLEAIKKLRGKVVKVFIIQSLS